MFGIETLHGPVRAAVTVGFVFIEALLLYVGYGALTQTIGTTVVDALQGD